MQAPPKRAPHRGSSSSNDVVPDRSHEQSVLFVDVVASTQIVCEYGDVEWADLLQRHARAMQAVVRHHHGRFGSFLGDGFLFLFDDAGDAVSAALRMRQAADVQDLFEIRMGLDHGPVVDVGENWSVGLTLHIASRLTDWCRPSEIVVSDRCYESARRSCAIPPAPRVSVQLRGVDDLTWAYVISRGGTR